MINIVDFCAAHTEEAQCMALDAYSAARRDAPALPPVAVTPDLNAYVDNGLGVTAFEGGRMVGFLCAVGPFGQSFRSTDAVGVFSPVHANAAIGADRARVYARMYQAAGEKWAATGASSHAVCLYAHDAQVQAQFFRYGFGLRCVDAIRGMDDVQARPCAGYEYVELPPDALPSILPLAHMLDGHMAASPTFILRPGETIEALAADAAIGGRFFAAKKEGATVAFIRCARDGETFVCDAPGYMHVMGAFCLPEHRGSGVYPHLLNTLIRALQRDGYTLLGVDFESINPAAHAFWLKHFAAYTHSVVRRIDEHAVRHYSANTCTD